MTVVGITLTQNTVSEFLGTTHTVTARLTDQLGEPMEGLEVTFDVIAGPNIGATGARNPTDGISDSAGQVEFTYSATRCGVDTIIAKFTMNGQCFTSQQLDVRVGLAVLRSPGAGDLGIRGRPDVHRDGHCRESRRFDAGGRSRAIRGDLGSERRC